MSLGDLVPLPDLRTRCRLGVGMAVCPVQGLVVTSDSISNTLNVFTLPQSISTPSVTGTGLALVYTLGGASPMQFKFLSIGNGFSGHMAFTGPATSRHLLVTDVGHDAVHVIDVAGRVHAGYVAAPGTIAGPWGLAAKGSLVAISAWTKWSSGDHVVRVFEGSGARWSAIREVAGGFGDPGRANGQLDRPLGLRFTGDGTGLVVADSGSGRVSVFRVDDGSFVRHVATGLSGPYDVEECQGGWLVACGCSNTVEFVDGGVGGDGRGGARLGKWGSGDGEFSSPSTLALVPGLGLVVREDGNYGRMQFFATPDSIAVSSMSAARVGWMLAVARGAAHRASSATRHHQQAGSTGKRRRQRGSMVRVRVRIPHMRPVPNPSLAHPMFTGDPTARFLSTSASPWHAYPIVCQHWGHTHHPNPHRHFLHNPCPHLHPFSTCSDVCGAGGGGGSRSPTLRTFFPHPHLPTLRPIPLPRRALASHNYTLPVPHNVHWQSPTTGSV